MERPKINYPCEWSYQIIGTDEKELKEAAVKILGNNRYKICLSNKSRGGKYVSLCITMIVASEEHRNRVYISLSEHPAVKIMF